MGSQEQETNLSLCWLSLLLAAVTLVMEAGIEDDVDVILVRTNIRKMITMLEMDLYLRSTEGMRIACKIHEELAHTARNPSEEPTTLSGPIEIRGVPLVLDETAVTECIVRLEGGKTL